MIGTYPKARPVKFYPVGPDEQDRRDAEAFVADHPEGWVAQVRYGVTDTWGVACYTHVIWGRRPNTIPTTFAPSQPRHSTIVEQR